MYRYVLFADKCFYAADKRFLQLAAAGSLHNILRFHCNFKVQMLLVHLNGDNHIQNFHLGMYIAGYTFGNHALHLPWRVTIKRNF